MDLSRSDSASIETEIKDPKGFATTFLIACLPLILAALFLFAFSGFLVKNWMQSLYICRTNLMKTQDQVAVDLKQLLGLNPLAQSLRIALQIAQAKLAAALASMNFEIAAQARIEISQIQAQQRNLDLTQKALIRSANFKMQSGAFKVFQELREQSQNIQSRLPWFFSYKINPRMPRPVLLAVQPDRPDIAPVYGLGEPFIERQALSVIWISEFASRNGEKMAWLTNKHSKRDSCSISLKKMNQDFQVQMTTDRLSPSY